MLNRPHCGTDRYKLNTAVFLLFSSIFILVPINAAQLKMAAQSDDDNLSANSDSALQTGREYFVDGIKGSDSNPGTIDQPLATIGKAAELAGPGDVVQIRGGLYLETINLDKSGDYGSPITFQAYQNETVIISGAVSVTGWSDSDGDGIYQANVPEAINLPPENYQVFINGQMAPQARESDLVDPSDPFSQQWLPTKIIKPAASVSLMTRDGQWVQAFQRGGSDVYATGASAGIWEEFYLIDVDGGSLEVGDEVGFLTFDHQHYLTAEGGGRPNNPEDRLVANRTNMYEWERFIIGRNFPGKEKGDINSGDWITLKAKKGGYLTPYDSVAKKCGGTYVYAGATNYSPCVDFLLVYKDISSVNILSVNNKYLSAASAQLRRVSDNGGSPGARTTFNLIDINGGALESGDQIGLRLDDGRYLGAENGGRIGSNDYLAGLSKEFGEAEKFIIEKTQILPPGNNVLGGFDAFTLKTAMGAYVSTTRKEDGQCAAGKILASSATVGECEKFWLFANPQPLAVYDQKTAGISQIENIWAGSYLWGVFRRHPTNAYETFQLGRWWADMAKISASKPGKLILSDTDNKWLANGWSMGDAVIISNKVGSIDAENEWVFEPKSNAPGGTLYLKPPEGVNPNGFNIEIRTKTWLIDGGVNVNFQSANGKYLREDADDLRRIKADSDNAGPQETFSLVDLNGGLLQTKDKIGIITNDGYYLTAENGGREDKDDYLAAGSVALGEWEMFTINKPEGEEKGDIHSGDQITLKSAEWAFASADITNGQCGGGFVHVNVKDKEKGECEKFTITTHEISHIVLRNLNFFAGQIKLIGNNNLLENVTVNYGSHFVYRGSVDPDSALDHENGNNGVYIRGYGNTIRNCKIAYSAGNAVTLVGNVNRVENCLIHDFGYMGPNSSGVFFDGFGAILRHSTMFNSGRDVLNLSKCKGCQITYNHLYNSTLIADDSGVIYTWGNDLEDTEIAYNWIQAVVGWDKVSDKERVPSPIQIGIYLDNNSLNAIVHHNVITDLSDKPGIGPNAPHDGHLLCNNTIVHNNLSGNAKPEMIGEHAGCSCSTNSELRQHFVDLNECYADLTNTKCINDKADYWRSPERLKVFNISPYYKSFTAASPAASDDLVNPFSVETDETGWRINGYPDFRPFDNAQSMVDKGTNCDQLIWQRTGRKPEVIGAAPDIGAYENWGTNWIPGYKETAYGVHDSYVMAKDQPYFVPAPGVLANDPPSSTVKRIYFIYENINGEGKSIFELSQHDDTWIKEDLTYLARHGSLQSPHPLSTRLTSLTAGGEPRIYYLGPSNKIHELVWLEAQQSWTWRDITSFNDAPPAAPDSQLKSITINGVPHVYYFSVDWHIHELTWTGKDWSVWDVDDWKHTDLTAVTNGLPAAPNSSFDVTKTSNDDPRIYFFAQDGESRHIHELAYKKLTGKWHHADLNNILPDAYKPVDGSPMAVTTAELRPRIYYLAEIAGETHLAEFYWYGNAWHFSDLTAVIDASTASTTARPEANSSLIATTVGSQGDPRIYFASGSTGAYHIFELALYSGQWNYRDITQDARAGFPALYTPLAVTTHGLLPHVYYLSSSMDVHELIWSAPDEWRDYEIAAGEANPNSIINSDLSAIASGGGPIYARQIIYAGHGTANLYPDGSFFYLPDEGYTGPDSFIYVVEDGFADSNHTYVNISVAEPPQQPATSSIKGTVTRESDGNPISNVSVSAYRYFGSTWEWVTQGASASDGSYEVDNLLPGLYRLRFQDSNGIYKVEYFPNKPNVESAIDIWVNTDGPTWGIDAALAYKAEVFSVVPFLAAGENFNCGLTTIGFGSCWGDNTLGQAKAKTGVYIEIATGANHACGLTPHGQATCWGGNSHGQANNQNGPFLHVSAGQDQTCGLTTAGAVFCWGKEGSFLDAVSDSGPFVQIAVGSNHICALKPEGLLTCWGQNNYGQLNHPDGLFNQLSAGADHTCALSIEGDVQCWGENSYGQAASQQGPFIQVAAGGYHSCALKPDGSIQCWGRNDDGQAEDNTGPFAYLSAGGFHTCGLSENGLAQCWGRNDYGQTDTENQEFPFGPLQPRILFPLIMNGNFSLKDTEDRQN